MATGFVFDERYMWHDTGSAAGYMPAGGDVGEITPFGQGSYEIARLALGGCLEAANAILQGKIKNGYALIRPIGTFIMATAPSGHFIRILLS